MSSFQLEQTTGKPYAMLTTSKSGCVFNSLWYFPEATKASLGNTIIIKPTIDASGHYTAGTGTVVSRKP